MKTGPVPVLLMVRELGAGGTERQFTEFLKAMDRERFAPHVCCFKDGFRAAELRAAQIPILTLPVDSFIKPHTAKHAWALRRYIRSHGIRLVHTWDFPANIFGVAARLAGVDVLLSSQRSHRELRTPRHRMLLRLSDRVVDAVVANCLAVKRHLMEEEGLAESRIRLCYNGIDLSRFENGERLRPELLRDAEAVIGVVALLRPEKSLDTLIEAFAKVLPAHPQARLVLVGSGPLEQALKEQARRLGAEKNCHFEPTTKDVAVWLRAMDIFVLPSRSEAFSNAIMEAMACGCAVVASRVGGNPELVIEGRTGLLFEAGNAADLAQQLRRLIEDPQLRRTLADAGARRIRSEFPLAVAARNLESIYGAFLDRTASKH